MIEWHCDDQIINMAFHALSQLKYWQTDCCCIAALDTHQHPIHQMWHCSQGSEATGTWWYHKTPRVLGHAFIPTSWSSPTSTRAAGGSDGDMSAFAAGKVQFIRNTSLPSLCKDKVTFRQPGAPPPQGPFEQDRLSAASRLLFVRCTSEHLGLEPWPVIAKRTRYMPSPSSQLMHISNRWLLYKKTAYSRKV